MKVILALILGIAIGAAVVWFYQGPRRAGSFSDTGRQVGSAMKSAGDELQRQLKALHLSGSEVSNELAQTGKVVREKARQAGQVLSDATSDARITAAIKTKLLRDPDLSAWNISVNTTDGVVTLSGSATSAANVGKAVMLALDTEGVRQVISTMQVKSK